jgi:hypothetical protein
MNVVRIHIYINTAYGTETPTQENHMPEQPITFTGKFLHRIIRVLVTANVVPSSMILDTLMMKAI